MRKYRVNFIEKTSYAIEVMADNEDDAIANAAHEIFADDESRAQHEVDTNSDSDVELAVEKSNRGA